MIRTDHMKLVRSIAWSFHFTTGLPFEDLFAECCALYCEGTRCYDKKDGPAKRTSYLYAYITYQLIFYVRREQYQKNIKWELELRKNEYQETPKYEMDNTFPPDVRTVMNIINDSNFNILELPPKMARGLLHRKLIIRGWTHTRAWSALRETQRCVMQTPEGCIIY